MNMSELADFIIVMAGLGFFVKVLGDLGNEIITSIDRKLKRRQRRKDHDKWLAARIAAREATEAKLRAEGRWDNYEIQNAMNAAGEAAVPGYRV